MPAKINVSKEYIFSIYEKYCNSKLGIHSIAKLEGYSDNTIKKWFKKEDLIFKSNENFFDEIDSEEKAYYLGLMYADGCISFKKGNRQPCIKIALQIKDGYILNKIQQLIQPFKPLNTIQFKNKNSQDQIVFSICSSHMANNLIKLGCFPNKSGINKEKLKWPIIKKELYPHFVRGFFDGDGSIFQSNFRKNCRHVEFYSVSKSFIFSLHNYLNMGSIYERSSVDRLTVYRLSIFRLDEVLKIKSLFYDKATLFIIRKKERFDSIAVPIRYPFSCPFCNSKNYIKKGTRNNKIRLKCRDCNKHYTY